MKAKNFLGMLLIGIAGSLIGVAIYSSLAKPKTVIVQKESAMPVQMTNYTGGYEAPDFRLAAAKSVHAVVHVKTVTSYKQQGYESIQDFVFGNPKTYNREIPGYGSGVIISEDGYIVTNNHVIDNSNSIEVTLNDGRVEKAEIIGRDPQTDVALIKIKSSNLPFLTFGSSADMEVGDWVLAVGNPFNLQSTVTAGIISAKGRSGIMRGNQRSPFDQSQQSQPRGIESFIQTDAAVNPGNSGGALVNLRGDLVGINTAIASQTGSYIGYSFAIPAAIAKKVVDDLKEFGKVQRVVIGIQGGTVVQELVEREKLKVNQGVYVTDLIEDGGALAAGLKSGDVIISIENQKVTSMSDLQEAIAPHRPGDKISVVVDRKGEEKTFTVTLKPQLETSKTLGASEFSSYIGADFEKLTEKELSKYEMTYGVRVSKLRAGKLKEAGVPEGFIITDINKTIKINEVEDIQAAIERSQDNRTILIEGVMPNGRYAYFAFRK
jgi:serine protease Do